MVYSFSVIAGDYFGGNHLAVTFDSRDDGISVGQWSLLEGGVGVGNFQKDLNKKGERWIAAQFSQDDVKIL